MHTIIHMQNVLKKKKERKEKKKKEGTTGNRKVTLLEYQLGK